MIAAKRTRLPRGFKMLRSTAGTVLLPEFESFSPAGTSNPAGAGAGRFVGPLIKAAVCAKVSWQRFPEIIRAIRVGAAIVLPQMVALI